MANEKITLGTTINDTHTFYSVLLKDRNIIRELLPKVDTNLTITNLLNVNDTGEFDDSAYIAMLGLVKLALREPETTQEDIEQWLDVRSAKLAIRTLLDLPVRENK